MSSYFFREIDVLIVCSQSYLSLVVQTTVIVQPDKICGTIQDFKVNSNKLEQIKACSSVLSSMKTSIELTRHFVSFEQKAADELINSRTVSVETFLSLETKRLNSREKKLLSIEILPQSKFFVIQNRFIIPICLLFQTSHETIQKNLPK